MGIFDSLANAASAAKEKLGLGNQGQAPTAIPESSPPTMGGRRRRKTRKGGRRHRKTRRANRRH